MLEYLIENTGTIFTPSIFFSLFIFFLPTALNVGVVFSLMLDYPPILPIILAEGVFEDHQTVPALLLPLRRSN